jgi:hypothetical protein
MTVVEEDYKWKGSFQTSNGQIKNASITDLVFLEKLKSGYRPNGPLLVTVSLSMPHEPDIVNWDKGPVCWKLIAGVIEIPSVGVQQSLDLGF